ncbi:MAG TPA: type II toxin-antitoxin system RelE/ParE family toxin [Opitutales bacterium]|nr:type II toxin-antitoxin system RelE/ParE family toxin [Opitutales bacterium]
MKSAKIAILDRARADLVEGHWFYEGQQPGLGARFLENIYADIESLRNFAGIHREVHRNHHRLLAKRFPYAIYYKLADQTASITAIVDCRRNPGTIAEKLR